MFFPRSIVLLFIQHFGPPQAFYSSNVFVDAGYSTKSALLASWGFGLVNFTFAFPAVWVRLRPPHRSK